MTPQAQKTLDDALLLTPTEREAMAIQLFDSLPAEAGVDLHEDLSDQESEPELARRIAELESKTVQGIPWKDARAMMFDLSDADSD
jgi:putative addiction module component (TIGR02574 family)